nr:xylulose kinase-1 [Tanacetum cinerariifolium]
MELILEHTQQGISHEVSNNVLSNTKKSSKKVDVSVRTNKKIYVASKNVVSNKKIITDMDVENTLKAKDVLCVSYAKNVLISCHDKYLANYILNVHSKVRRALFTTSRTIKSKLEDTTHVVSKTRFSVKTIQSKSLDTYGMIKVLPPKTAKEVVARERERKARTTLLMALPEDHLAKFRKMADAKEMFQTLLSQLEIHGAGVSYEDANQKFLRSLPSSWSQVALIMRTKRWLDTLSFDDLYNNLRVFERNVKGTTASSSNILNVAFVSADNTSSTNDVSTTYNVSSPSVTKSQKEGYSSYTDEFDTKDPVGLVKTKVECFNCHKIGNFARDYRAKGNQYNRRRDVGYNVNKTKDNGRKPAYRDDSKALVTIEERILIGLDMLRKILRTML